MNRRYVAVLLMALVAFLAPWWASHQPRNEPPHIAAAAAAVELAHIPEAAPLSLIIEPQDGVGMLLDSIENAKTSIDLVVYELDDAAIEQALASAEARGVAVRVILENLNSFGNHPNQAAFDFLHAHHVPVKWSEEYFALTHQKTLVIDNTLAYVMTFNLASKYYPTSRDFGLIDPDEVDVAAIEAAFDSDWTGSEADATRGRDLVWSPGSAPTLLGLINSASNTLDIYALELADARVTAALEDAAHRGVRVRIVMTYATNWKPVLNELTQKSVTVRTFASTAKTYVHAKAIIADGSRAFIGSENFSNQSLDQNRELGILFSRADIIEKLETTFEKDFAAARPYAVKK